MRRTLKREDGGQWLMEKAHTEEEEEQQQAAATNIQKINRRVGIGVV